MGTYFDAILTIFRTDRRYLVASKLALLFQITKISVKNQYFFSASHRIPRIIDCGSHVGLSVLYFKLLYPTSEIIAIEPDPLAFSLLKQNIGNNRLGKVKLMNMAVSDKQGKAVLLTNPNIKADWASKLKMTTQVTKQEPKKVIVKTIALSQIVKNQIDLLKIDIEGLEEKAISDLKKNNLLGKVKAFIIEYHSPNSQENINRLSRILKALESHHFSYYIHYSWRYKWKLRPAYMLFRYLVPKFNFLIYAQRENRVG